MEQTITDTFTGASFSFSNRVSRVIWGAVYTIFFRFSPRPFHKWRAFILRCFGAKLGVDVHVYPGVKIWAPWNLEWLHRSRRVLPLIQRRVTGRKRFFLTIRRLVVDPIGIKM